MTGLMGVELGYMTDQGRDRGTEVGGGGGSAQSVAVSSAGMYRERWDDQCFVQMS